MKLGIVLPDLRGGGVERIRLVLARHFLRAGHGVEFVLMRSSGALLAEVRAEFPIHDLHADRVREVPCAIQRYIRDRRPDGLLAAMWPLTAAVPIGVMSSRNRCPVLVSEHNNLPAQYAAKSRMATMALRSSVVVGYRLASARVGVSRGVAQDMARLSGMCLDRFEVIYNPVRPIDMPSEEDLEVASKMWKCPQGGRVLTVGSLKPQKNQKLLLEAFARIRRSDRMLMLLGQGELEEDLRGYAVRLGIADRVAFGGFQGDPTAFYQSADVFVLSSNYEGFGNVIVEALANGLSVVSTDCPSGPSEILDGGTYGTLVPPGDAMRLATAIENALLNPSNPETLKQRAARFSAEAAATRYLELMEKCWNA